MYRLTPRMLQRFKRDLGKYHELFSGGRCGGWEQEELIVNAIKADTSAQHHVQWQEAGHDDKADIRVRTNGETHPIQIKSGQIKQEHLVLSGHRLGRFKGDMKEITNYLRSTEANIISVAYTRMDDDDGRKHIYQVRYVAIHMLQDLSVKNWKKKGTNFEQINSFGIKFEIHPSMSWQIWWKIPLELADEEEPFVFT